MRTRQLTNRIGLRNARAVERVGGRGRGGTGAGRTLCRHQPPPRTILCLIRLTTGPRPLVPAGPIFGLAKPFSLWGVLPNLQQLVLYIPTPMSATCPRMTGSARVFVHPRAQVREANPAPCTGTPPRYSAKTIFSHSIPYPLPYPSDLEPLEPSGQPWHDRRDDERDATIKKIH